IDDIYDGRGIDEARKTADAEEGVTRTVEAMHERPDGLVFTNLVDFDAVYGHRRDVDGYGAALARFDARLPELTNAVGPDDLLLLASDHGNDPTWPGTDHTREHGLVLAYGLASAGVELGTRGGFSDLGATVAEALGAPWDGAGASFLSDLR
ncbi:MAG: phosphopentomutase, partial [Trueperaceae bacterium]